MERNRLHQRHCCEEISGSTSSSKFEEAAMASRLVGFAVLLFLVVAFSCQGSDAYAVQGSLGRGRQLLKKIDCSSACVKRCEDASANRRCKKYCGICCNECNCVPSGHYGNKNECSCYRDKKNKKGESKCP